MVGNTIASMIAYLIAQSVDVRMYHFWKRLTKGKHLWLRNNASTTVSHLDSTAIITILYLAGNPVMLSIMWAQLSYLFLIFIYKFFFALFDTPIILSRSSFAQETMMKIR